MAISLTHNKMIPATELNKIHIISWIQTEDQTAPYRLSIQGQYILYGHNGDGGRVYDPDGAQRIFIEDFRETLGELLAEMEPEDQAKVMGMQQSYIAALAYMIGLKNPELGGVTSE